MRSRERHAAPLQWCTPFNDSRYGLQVPSRDCHVASLLAMTNRGPLPFYRYPIRIGGAAPGGACPSPTTHGRRPAYFSFFIFQSSVFISMRPLPYNAFRRPCEKFHAPRFTFSSTNFPFPVHNRLHWRGNLLRGGTTRMEQELRRLPG